MLTTHGDQKRKRNISVSFFSLKIKQMFNVYNKYNMCLRNLWSLISLPFSRQLTFFCQIAATKSSQSHLLVCFCLVFANVSSTKIEHNIARHNSFQIKLMLKKFLIVKNFKLYHNQFQSRT